jgi:hypothetical protein
MRSRPPPASGRGGARAARDARRRAAAEEGAARRVRARRRHGDGRALRGRSGRLAPRLRAPRPPQRRPERELRLLRRAPPTRRAGGGAGPRLLRGVRRGLPRRRPPARRAARLDRAPGALGTAGRREPRTGDAAHAPRIPLGRDLVDRLHDPAAPPRARARGPHPPRRRARGDARAARADGPPAPPPPPGRAAPRRVPRLQRRDRHDHPDGGDLRQRARPVARALVGAILLAQLIGVPCAYLFAAVAGRLGAKPRSWAASPSTRDRRARLSRTAAHSSRSRCSSARPGRDAGAPRSLFASMVPRHLSGEFFGFFAVSEKFAGSSVPRCSPRRSR